MENTIDVLLLMFMVFGLIGFITFKYYNQYRLRNRQRVGLQLLQALQRMLAHVQQHRGLNYGSMKGAQELDRKILDVKHFISDDIHRIEHSSAWLPDTQNWQKITETWAKLTIPYNSWNCESNFSKHNELVQLILNCIDSAVAEYYLAKLQTKGTDQSYSYLWQELLPTTELLGQVRALGTGIAACGFHNCEDQRRIQELIRAIEINVDCLWMNIINSYELEHDISKFLSSIDEKIMARKPLILPQEYFDLGTIAIDGLYNHYQLEIHHLIGQIYRDAPLNPLVD